MNNVGLIRFVCNEEIGQTYSISPIIAINERNVIVKSKNFRDEMNINIFTLFSKLW